MEWLTDELLCYGGAALAGITMTAAVLYLLISKIQFLRLESRLDHEYGTGLRKKRKKKHG